MYRPQTTQKNTAHLSFLLSFLFCKVASRKLTVCRGLNLAQVRDNFCRVVARGHTASGGESEPRLRHNFCCLHHDHRLRTLAVESRPVALSVSHWGFVWSFWDPLGFLVSFVTLATILSPESYSEFPSPSVASEALIRVITAVFLKDYTQFRVPVADLTSLGSFWCHGLYDLSMVSRKQESRACEIDKLPMLSTGKTFYTSWGKPRPVRVSLEGHVGHSEQRRRAPHDGEDAQEGLGGFVCRPLPFVPLCLPRNHLAWKGRHVWGKVSVERNSISQIAPPHPYCLTFRQPGAHCSGSTCVGTFKPPTQNTRFFAGHCWENPHFHGKYLLFSRGST